jgi:dihydroorotate dehydrogenase
MASTSDLPRYDSSRSYAWNYDHAPDPITFAEPAVPGDWDFCSLPVGSPLGIAAGPLLNGKWCLYYAGLGFDVLTYKTVRTGQRDCYQPPNLQPVQCETFGDAPTFVHAADEMKGSWAVSFGMPSADPDLWRRDIEWTRSQLPANKILAVSVVGTVQDGWTMDDLANDYALCARWAVESGADCIETNFSCPNVTTCDGQLYQHTQHSRLVAQTVRAAIGKTPYIIKIGHLVIDQAIASLLDAVGDVADALAMTNSIASQVMQDEQFMFAGQQRGICGAAIRDESIRQVKRFANVIEAKQLSTKLVGVGGIAGAADVQSYLDAGAHACQLATAPMIDPMVGLKIRRHISSA